MPLATPRTRKNLTPFSFPRLAGAALLLTATLSHAATETVPSNAQLAFPSENQGSSARAVAMGSAFVAVGGDVASLSWNPAGLATLRSPELAFHHNFYLQDFLEDTVAFATPQGPFGSWGLSADYLSYGSLQGRDASGNVTGNYSAGRWGGEAAWAHVLFKGFYLGLGVKGNLMTLGGSSYSNIAGDVGALWDLNRSFHLGASYANWGTDITGNIANSVARFGGACNWDWSKGHQAMLAASVSWEPYGVTHLNTGFEDLLGSFLAVRAGYNWDLASTNLQGLTNLTAGAGFYVKDFVLDYAYSPFGDLGSSNQVSLTYRFPAVPAPTAAPLAKPVPALPFAPVPVRPTPVPVLVLPTPVPSPTPTPPANPNKLKLFFNLPEGQAAATADPLAAQTQAYQDAIAQNPQNAGAWYQLGMIYFQNKRREEAIQCFEQVLRLKPDDQRLKDWLERYKNQAL